MDASTSGSVTATLTWVPDTGKNMQTDPPPANVLVAETASASASGGNCPSSQYTASDGLGDPQNPSSGIGSASSSGTHYSIKNGSSGTITLTNTLSAGTPGYNTPVTHGGASVSVSYSAQGYPVLISINGSPFAQSILIGQQVTASLSAGPLTPSSLSWTISGGNPFSNYTASSSSATYTPLGSLTTNPIDFYFAVPDSASLTCSAHLAVPAGAFPSAGLNVSVTNDIEVDKPSTQLEVAIGSVTDLPTATDPVEVQLQNYYYYPPSGEAQGIYWYGIIATPTQYVVSGNYGSWNWTQLITPSDQRKDNGVYQEIALDSTNPPTIIYGIQCLDNMYPYGSFTYPANGVQDGNSDSPAEPLG